MNPTFTPTPAEAAAIADVLAQTVGTSPQPPTERNTAMHGNSGRVTDNGATMTAAELIELLKAHPKACGAIGVRVDLVFQRDVVRLRELTLLSDGTPSSSAHFDNGVDAILGAAQEYADEKGIEIVQDRECPPKFLRVTGQLTYTVHDTRLHALLAGIEATA